MISSALLKDIIKRDPCEVIHKKTGNVYTMLMLNVKDATNATDGRDMILYYKDGMFFVREAEEFYDKFTPVVQ